MAHLEIEKMPDTLLKGEKNSIPIAAKSNFSLELLTSYSIIFFHHNLPAISGPFTP